MRIQGRHIGPTLPAQSIYDTSSTPKATLGDMLTIGDRAFRYCKAGGSDIAAGVMIQTPAGSTNNKNLPVLAAAGQGATAVSFTLAGVTANDFAGGWLGVYDVSTGVGNTYRIKSNTASGIASAYTVTATLYDGLAVALTTNDKVCVIANRYNGVILAPYTSQTGDLIGVSAVAVTAAYYFWAQTKGPATVLAGGAWGLGKPLCRSAAVDGALAVQAAGTASVAQQVAGFALSDTEDTKYGICRLKLD